MKNQPPTERFLERIKGLPSVEYLFYFWLGLHRLDELKTFFLFCWFFSWVFQCFYVFAYNVFSALLCTQLALKLHSTFQSHKLWLILLGPLINNSWGGWQDISFIQCSLHMAGCLLARVGDVYVCMFVLWWSCWCCRWRCWWWSSGLGPGRRVVGLLPEAAGRGGVQVPLGAQASGSDEGEVLGAHRQRGGRGQVPGTSGGHRAEKLALGSVNSSTRARAQSRSSENEGDKRVRVNRGRIFGGSF